MAKSNPHNERLARLMKWKTRPEPDYSLSFIKKQFKQQVEKPYKQLGDLGALWQRHLPADLQAHTRLDGLSRGTLRVTVDSSEVLFEIDRLLRTGLEAQLKREHKGPLTRVRLTVGAVDTETSR